MNAAQEKALDQIIIIVREHFSGGIVIVEGESELSDGATDVKTAWHGGHARAVGLCDVAKHSLLHKSDEDLKLGIG